MGHGGAPRDTPVQHGLHYLSFWACGLWAEAVRWAGRIVAGHTVWNLGDNRDHINKKHLFFFLFHFELTPFSDGQLSKVSARPIVINGEKYWARICAAAVYTTRLRKNWNMRASRGRSWAEYLSKRREMRANELSAVSCMSEILCRRYKGHSSPKLKIKSYTKNRWGC